MKQIAWITLFIAQLSVAQIKCINNSLNYSDTNLAYIGVSNKLTFTVNENIDTSLSVICKNDTLSQYRKYYFFRPHSVGTNTLLLYKKEQLIDSIIMNVDVLNKPIFRYGNIKDTIISIEEFIQNNSIGLQLNHPNKILKISYNISSFNGYIIKSGKKIKFEDLKRFSYVKRIEKWSSDKVERKSYKKYSSNKYSEQFIQRNKFDKKSLKTIKKLTPGDQIIFNLARIRCPSCKGFKKKIDLKFTVDSN